MSKKEEDIVLLNNNPKKEVSEEVVMLMGKIGEVLAACSTLKARLDILEDHVVYLLSQNPKYLDLMAKKQESKNHGQKDKSIS